MENGCGDYSQSGSALPANSFGIILSRIIARSHSLKPVAAIAHRTSFRGRSVTRSLLRVTNICSRSSTLSSQIGWSELETLRLNAPGAFWARRFQLLEFSIPARRVQQPTVTGRNWRRWSYRSLAFGNSYRSRQEPELDLRCSPEKNRGHENFSHSDNALWNILEPAGLFTGKGEDGNCARRRSRDRSGCCANRNA